MVGTSRPSHRRHRRRGSPARRCRRADDLEVLDRRSAERDLLAADRLQGLVGGQPAYVDDLVPIGDRLLAGRSDGREEARVEPDGVLLGRDPVGEVAEAIRGERELLGAKHVEERTVRGLAGDAVGFEARAVVVGDADEGAVRPIREQHPDFLECLSDRPHPVAQRLARAERAAEPRGGVLRGEAAAKGLDVVGNVVGLHLAPREDVVARGELALGVALNEEHLDARRVPVAHEDQRGGGGGDGGRRHGVGGVDSTSALCHERGVPPSAEAQAGSARAKKCCPGPSRNEKLQAV